MKQLSDMQKLDAQASLRVENIYSKIERNDSGLFEKQT